MSGDTTGDGLPYASFEVMERAVERAREKYRIERDKRLRPDGANQYRSLRTTDPLTADPFTPRVEQRTPRSDHVEVAVVGAGFAGLLMAATLRMAGHQSVRLIDTAGGVGGTWYWNRYPGVNCDIESYIYLPLLEETGYMPRRKYSDGAEIRAYCERIARDFGIIDDLCLQTNVTEMAWDEESCRWAFRTDRGDAFTARFAVIAGGSINIAKIPRIPGIDDYRGHIFHTARWDYEYTGGSEAGGLDGLGDKTVGIVGTGATAVQCVPHVGSAARQLYVFQRTPSSIDVRANRPTDPEWFSTLSPGWQQARMENFLAIVHGGTADVDLVDDGWTRAFRTLAMGSRRPSTTDELDRRERRERRRLVAEAADLAKMDEIRGRVDRIVSDPTTADSLKPWYRRFCKRPCFHDEYLQTFDRPNVHLVDTDGRGVTAATPTGVICGNDHYDVDCLIFATGFETDTKRVKGIGATISGRQGITLEDHWSNEPRAMHGLMTHGFPNLFFLPGPQSAFSVLVPFSYREQAVHIAHLVNAVSAKGASGIEATASGEQRWGEVVRQASRSGVDFYRECTPGYYNNEGQVDESTVLTAGRYAGNPLDYLRILERWREDGEFQGVTFL